MCVGGIKREKYRNERNPERNHIIKKEHKSP